MLPPHSTWPYLTGLIGASLCVAAILVIALCLARKEKKSTTSPANSDKAKPKTSPADAPKSTTTTTSPKEVSPYAAAVLLTQQSEDKESSTELEMPRDDLSALDSVNSSRQPIVAVRPSVDGTDTTTGSNRPPSGSESTPSPSPRQTLSGEDTSGGEEPSSSGPGRPSAEAAPTDTEATDQSGLRTSTGSSTVASAVGSANTDQAPKEAQSDPALHTPLIVISPPDSAPRSTASEPAPAHPGDANHLTPPHESPGGGGAALFSPALSPAPEPHLDRKGSTVGSKPPAVFRPEWMIDYSDIEFKRKIGAGSFGTVFLGLYEGEECAIKQASFTVEEEALEDFKREAALILSIKPHPAIVQVLGISSNETDIYVIMEYCDRGSLDKLVQKVKMDSFSKLKLLQSSAAGIAHLHREHIVHRDIAARNILVSSPLRAKVADFGMSRIVNQFDDKGVTASNIGPIRWMSPESIGKREYSTASDVWMFGILCTEVWNEKPPHHGMDNFEVAMKIRYEGYHPDIPADMPAWLKEVCLQCWNLDPSQRPTMASIVARFKTEMKILEDAEK